MLCHVRYPLSSSLVPVQYHDPLSVFPCQITTSGESGRVKYQEPNMMRCTFPSSGDAHMASTGCAHQGCCTVGRAASV